MKRFKPKLNGVPPPDGSSGEIPHEVKEMLKGGLALLWRAFEYARDLDIDNCEFAVECDALYHAGLSAIDLRWLLARQYVECTCKTPPSGSGKLSSVSSQNVDGTNDCFVLTSSGAALALQLLTKTRAAASQLQLESAQLASVAEPAIRGMDAADVGKKRPSWDRDQKVLRYGQWIVKQFKCLAANQETILMAFEEDGWPTRIDDPLPQKLNQDPKCRLHDTIKCLNRNHRARLIRFSGDGTGEGVVWTLVDVDETLS
ncbi:MAG TPA: hypothetical protein VHR66_24860 [Gemmataceae bacterium]|jgi:hypothetical protein|nr:hypothetical protein [Gemmataceae bacterium]